MSVYHCLSGIFSFNILLGFIQQMGDNSKNILYFFLTEILAAFRPLTTGCNSCLVYKCCVTDGINDNTERNVVF